MKQYFKTIIIGEKSTGKTSIINRLCNEELKAEKAIGANYSTKTIQQKENKVIITFWELSNKEKFKTMYNNYCQGTHAAMYIIDQTRPRTINYIKRFRKQEYLPNKTIEIVLGNKSDLEEKINKSLIPTSVKYYPVSARTGNGLIKAINYLTNKLIK